MKTRKLTIIVLGAAVLFGVLLPLAVPGCQTNGKNDALEQALLTSAGHLAAVAYLDSVDAEKAPVAATDLATAAEGVIGYLDVTGGTDALYGAVAAKLGDDLGNYGPVLTDLAAVFTADALLDAPLSAEDRGRALAFLRGVRRGAQTYR